MTYEYCATSICIPCRLAYTLPARCICRSRAMIFTAMILPKYAGWNQAQSATKPQENRRFCSRDRWSSLSPVSIIAWAALRVEGA